MSLGTSFEDTYAESYRLGNAAASHRDQTAALIMQQRSILNQYSQQYQQSYTSGLMQLLMGNQPGMLHIETIREFRKRFKEHSKAEFREMGNKPVIKDILSGMTKLNKEEIKSRIAEHLAVA